MSKVCGMLLVYNPVMEVILNCKFRLVSAILSSPSSSSVSELNLGVALYLGLLYRNKATDTSD